MIKNQSERSRVSLIFRLLYTWGSSLIEVRIPAIIPKIVSNISDHLGYDVEQVRGSNT